MNLYWSEMVLFQPYSIRATYIGLKQLSVTPRLLSADLIAHYVDLKWALSSLCQSENVGHLERD